MLVRIQNKPNLSALRWLQEAKWLPEYESVHLSRDGLTVETDEGEDLAELAEVSGFCCDCEDDSASPARDQTPRLTSKRVPKTAGASISQSPFKMPKYKP